MFFVLSPQENQQSEATSIKIRSRRHATEETQYIHDPNAIEGNTLTLAKTKTSFTKASP
jgi:hypothetical protein